MNRVKSGGLGLPSPRQHARPEPHRDETRFTGAGGARSDRSRLPAWEKGRAGRDAGSPGTGCGAGEGSVVMRSPITPGEPGVSPIPPLVLCTLVPAQRVPILPFLRVPSGFGDCKAAFEQLAAPAFPTGASQGKAQAPTPHKGGGEGPAAPQQSAGHRQDQSLFPASAFLLLPQCQS